MIDELLNLISFVTLKPVNISKDIHTSKITDKLMHNFL